MTDAPFTETHRATLKRLTLRERVHEDDVLAADAALAEIDRLRTLVELLIVDLQHQIDLRIRADADAEKMDRLRDALQTLRIDANRLCDRQLGGTYEDDCRRSIAKADDVLRGDEAK